MEARISSSHCAGSDWDSRDSRTYARWGIAGLFPVRPWAFYHWCHKYVAEQAIAYVAGPGSGNQRARAFVGDQAVDLPVCAPMME